MTTLEYLVTRIELLQKLLQRNGWEVGNDNSTNLIISKYFVPEFELEKSCHIILEDRPSVSGILIRRLEG